MDKLSIKPSVIKYRLETGEPRSHVNSGGKDIGPSVVEHRLLNISGRKTA